MFNINIHACHLVHWCIILFVLLSQSSSVFPHQRGLQPLVDDYFVIYKNVLKEW
jgi:hypothetical protein